jgi:hypothetical protein
VIVHCVVLVPEHSVPEQTPRLQLGVAPLQTVVHVPQCSGSVSMLTQTPLHCVRPALHP